MFSFLWYSPDVDWSPTGAIQSARAVEWGGPFIFLKNLFLCLFPVKANAQGSQGSWAVWGRSGLSKREGREEGRNLWSSCVDQDLIPVPERDMHTNSSQTYTSEMVQETNQEPRLLSWTMWLFSYYHHHLSMQAGAPSVVLHIMGWDRVGLLIQYVFSGYRLRGLLKARSSEAEPWMEDSNELRCGN